MAGHSKWANIKHRKAVQDSRRSKVWTRILREVTIASRQGGPEPENNPSLRLAIQNAKGANIPKDTVERAVRKGSGQEADNLQPVVYECYGPSGLGIIIEATTENLNRTLGNIRANLNKYGGSLASRGALNFVFVQKGVFMLDAPAPEQADEVEMLLIDAGADDVQRNEHQWEVHCAFEDFGPMVQALHDAGIQAREANLQRIPVIFKKLAADDARLALKLIAKLEEDDDIDTVYHNLEYDEALAEALIASGDL